jgi:hypothetical protein
MDEDLEVELRRILTYLSEESVDNDISTKAEIHKNLWELYD